MGIYNLHEFDFSTRPGQGDFFFILLLFGSTYRAEYQAQIGRWCDVACVCVEKMAKRALVILVGGICVLYVCGI